jgi:hypothetical protein
LGFVSKTVPEHKWSDVFPDIALKLKKDADSWFRNFIDDNPYRQLGVQSPIMNNDARRLVHLLQLSVFATTIQEFSYVKYKDVLHVVELAYIGLTGNPSTLLVYDFPDMPRGDGDPRETLDPWAKKLARIISDRPEDPALLKASVGMGLALLITTKGRTCRGCGDSRTADRMLREVLRR